MDESQGGALPIHQASSAASASAPNPASDEAPIISLPHQDADTISHFAIDIGGSLIKLIYFTSADANDYHSRRGQQSGDPTSGYDRNMGGRLHFVKFETSRLDQAIDFIRSKGLHQCADGNGQPVGRITRVKATGGGAFKFYDRFRSELGLQLEREDEMDCLVSGANFFLRTVRYAMQRVMRITFTYRRLSKFPSFVSPCIH